MTIPVDDGSSQVGRMVSGAAGRENVSPEVKDEYDQLMQSIRDILLKGNYSDQDAKDIEKALKDLKKLQWKYGLETKMNDDLAIVLGFFKAYEYDPDNSSAKIDPALLDAISKTKVPSQDASGKPIELTLVNMLDNAVNNPNATQTLGDMLLEFSFDCYNMYAGKVDKLTQQIKVSTQVIQDLKALQQILNLVKSVDRGSYKLPPEGIDDIPPEIREKLKLENIPGVTWSTDANGQLIASDFLGLQNWIKNNGNKYIEWSNTFFTAKISSQITTNLGTSDTIVTLLKTRDDLLAQLETLKAGGADTSPGSPYDTIQKVVDDIDAKLPREKYPPNSDWDTMFKKEPITGADGKITYQYTYPSDAVKGVNQWIMGGQDTGTINNTIDNALEANQTLSGKMSDELKAKNLFLQTMYEILTNVSKSLTKILEGMGRKAGGGG